MYNIHDSVPLGACIVTICCVVPCLSQVVTINAISPFSSPPTLPKDIVNGVHSSFSANFKTSLLVPQIIGAFEP